MQIPAPYDTHCERCPYYNQIHLANSPHITERSEPPIGLEDNSSDILLVFQSPGKEEWKKGEPLQPIKNQGGTAGCRIKRSWERKGKIRANFDIVNSVQCFQGKNSTGRDAKLNTMAICYCSNRLLTILQRKNYAKVITFGKNAQQVLSSIISQLSPQPTPINHPHPTSSKSSNATLDALWENSTSFIFTDNLVIDAKSQKNLPRLRRHNPRCARSD